MLGGSRVGILCWVVSTDGVLTPHTVTLTTILSPVRTIFMRNLHILDQDLFNSKYITEWRPDLQLSLARTCTQCLRHRHKFLRKNFISVWMCGTCVTHTIGAIAIYILQPVDISTGRPGVSLIWYFYPGWLLSHSSTILINKYFQSDAVA